MHSVVSSWQCTCVVGVSEPAFCFRLSGKLVEGNYQKQIDKKKSKTQSAVCICLGPQRSSFFCKAAERTEERAPILLPKVWQAGRQANASLIRPSLPCSNCSSTWLGINEDASRHNLHSRSRLKFRHDRLHRYTVLQKYRVPQKSFF